jgi:hypothetical protein
MYVSDNRGIFFKIGLNEFGVFLQNLQKKIRKEREKRNRKEEKAVRELLARARRVPRPNWVDS